MFWSKKQYEHPEPRPVSSECNHKYEDFDWYIDFSVKGSNLNFTIVKPYVCIHCKKRKNVTLEGPISYSAQSNEGAWTKLAEIQAKYPKIKDRAIVEDEINDAQLVDREYIRIAKWLQGTHVPANNIKLTIEKTSDGQQQ